MILITFVTHCLGPLNLSSEPAEVDTKQIIAYAQIEDTSFDLIPRN